MARILDCQAPNLFEIVGYAARGVSHGQAPDPTLAPCVIQTLLLLVAPVLFAASIYMVLGRIILSVDGESYSLIKKRWLTKTFVSGDVLSFFIQLGGGGLMASSKASIAKTGSHIVLIGLVIQIVLFGLFIAVAVVFHLRLRGVPRACSLLSEKFVWILYIASTFVMIRSIVRVAEFIEGFEGTIIRHEAYLYIFDAIPVAAVMVIFNVWYPSYFSKQAGTAAVMEQNADSNLELSDVERDGK
ncbi:uncharacterized protein Z519_03977 [Cladophialophora bantiana CBS 173.52]|uniref:RTA1 domain protein n=1 Tax=Cladophialophora bantiana (strain ATCC 10958 / CBS 173.52 / CDC B-1940 / NIH 8579) TaxID=1442370 RepID=A0A0D2HPP3_CLAB1|nr:uncharacterized protein Z519_03977 [Cladophialophora bantiana CBS 173.52]KIW95393.1 hypothetical protein Z519_03977 [Cladophialophora bantiana CBS 173.52]